MVPSLPEEFGGAQGEVPLVQGSAPAEGNESVSVIHTLSHLFTLVCAEGHLKQLHHRAWTV